LIRRVEQLHGSVLARLLRSDRDVGITVRRHPSCRLAYILDERVALYVKYATDRMSPWAFNFGLEYQVDVSELQDQFDEVFVALVCGTDGIACLTTSEYSHLLDQDPKDGEWIKVTRRAREKYSVTASDERRVRKVADKDFPSKVLIALSALHPKQS
jgi:hypothetical protein